MMVVVGAINVIGRIMAKRAKDRLAAEQAKTSESSAESKRIDRRRAVVPARATPAPLRDVMRMPAHASGRAVPRDDVPGAAVSIISAPISVASLSMAAQGQARVAQSQPLSARPVGPRWSARRLRDGLVAAEILGPPVALRA